MIKVYISGPMTGYPSHNVEAFNHAEDVLVAAGAEPLNPAHNMLGEEAMWSDFMRHDIRLLTTADEVLLLPGWEKSKGASLEALIARELGIPVNSLSWWQRKAGMSAHQSGGTR